jgi:hypothetical protein
MITKKKDRSGRRDKSLLHLDRKIIFSKGKEGKSIEKNTNRKEPLFVLLLLSYTKFGTNKTNSKNKILFIWEFGNGNYKKNYFYFHEKKIYC